MMNPNNAYVEELYFQYLRNPDAVSAEWKQYFAQHREELTQQISEERGQELASAASALQAEPEPVRPPVKAPQPVPAREDNGRQSVSAPAGNGQPAAGPAQPAPKTASPAPAAPKPKPEPKVVLGPADEAEKLGGVPERIVNNMESSLEIPTATSLRTIPTIVLDENRRTINHMLRKRGEGKVSFTHIIAWAIVKALAKYPSMNCSFARIDGKPHRIKRAAVNLGLAVDVARKDGSRSLVVPSVKDAASMDFGQFLDAYEALVSKARSNSLTLDDLMGATVTLTNPGGIGTVASMPRLMQGQGLIVATGSIDFPPEFQGMSKQVKAAMAIGKQMTMTSTYDHRIIQGAESGEFLQYIHKLLTGEDYFYDQIYAALNVLFEPFRWSVDNSSHIYGVQDQKEVIEKESKVLQLINAYRVRGHLYADVNPLGHSRYDYPELELSYYDFSVWDMDREYDTGTLGGLKRTTLREIVTRLRDIYCNKIGLEFMHIQEPRKKMWIRDKFETDYAGVSYDRTTRLAMFRKLVDAETFEKFLGTRFLGQKRFSLEGGETLIAMLDQLLNKAADYGVDEIYMGMAHRGRLNVLVNIIGKSAEKVFREFQGVVDPDSFHGSGDVKYHLGAKGSVSTSNGRKVTIRLASNPSHLEAVNPVVEGMARARIDERGEKSGAQIMPILIHGDAAFAGQGVVTETLNLANLRGYRTGGTIHIIINNQIGFTTLPEESRSTVYATDVAKMLQVPILHVNGDDPEAVLTAAAFAIDYRSEFGQDVVIDMLCYRKFGHNEADEPGYTQPLLYQKIRRLQPWSEHYKKRLMRDDILTEDNAKKAYRDAKDRWERAIEAEAPEGNADTGWTPPAVFASVHTPVPEETLKSLAQTINTFPPEFRAHRKLVDLFNKRLEAIEKGSGIDWGNGEALAFASLLNEGYFVRLSGQDSSRGTFTHRHAVLVDQVNESELVPLNQVTGAEQSRFSVFDSSLSELAVLGFDYGYTVMRKEGLTLWEAQFGDFSNGAQILFDQFISSAEGKWGQTSNLVVLLPHGYEGQGPEHSSARLERFLQLCADDNMTVAYYTTPANYFHALRRQVLRDFHKPLIIMAPKGYLRRPISTLAEFTQLGYRELIDDESVSNPNEVRRLLFCSGKVYFDLLEWRSKNDIKNLALVRVEQLYPLHADRLRELLMKYRAVSDIRWVQEEPKNMGAWSFMEPRLRELLLDNQRLQYVGRPESASPATGHSSVHFAEQKRIMIAACE